MDSSILMDCGCNVAQRLSQLLGHEQRDRVCIIKNLDLDFASINACCHFACTF